MTDDDGRLVLLVDGAERQTFSAPTAPCAVKSAQAAGSPQLPRHHIVRYLADGSLLIVARDADGWGVYHDETRWASYPVSNIDPPDDDCKKTAVLAHGSIRRAEGAPVVAWFERLPGEEERWRVVRNGKPIDDFVCSAPWLRQPPELDAAGRHIAYACTAKNAQDQDQVFVVRDGVRYGPYPEVWGMALSDNGAHVTYGAADGEPPRPWAIYFDGEKRTGRYASTWRPRVSDDGATVVWGPGRRQWSGTTRHQSSRHRLLRQHPVGAGVRARRSRGLDHSPWAEAHARQRVAGRGTPPRVGFSLTTAPRGAAYFAPPFQVGNRVAVNDALGGPGAWRLPNRLTPRPLIAD